MQAKLLNIVDKVQRAIEDKKISCGIFLDLSNDFDTLDHTILIKNLEYCGVQGTVGDQ